MYDILEVIENINSIYNNNNSLEILKDYERVLDELDTYVFENWENGELISGPNIERHWVTCEFMWPYKKMPNPEAAKKLTEYGCQVSYRQDSLISPRKIESPEDFRPGSKKGKLDQHPIWIVEIQMPKKLILDVFRGHLNMLTSEIEKNTEDAPDQLVVPQAEEQMMQSPNTAMAGSNTAVPTANPAVPGMPA